jgi:hypothetical protein
VVSIREWCGARLAPKVWLLPVGVLALGACADEGVDPESGIADTGVPTPGTDAASADAASDVDPLPADAADAGTPDAGVGDAGAVDSGSGDDTSEQSCVDNEAFFAEQLFPTVIESRCMVCHTSEGLARDSGMVFVTPVQPNYLQENLETLTGVAGLEQDGTSIILLKPLGQLYHGGGAVLSSDSVEYGLLEEFVARLDAPVECADEPTSDPSDGLKSLTPVETLRKVALLLAGRLPTAEEYDDVRFGGERALGSAIDSFMREEAFYVRMQEIFNDELLVERYNRNQDALSLLDDDIYVTRYWHLDEPTEAMRNLMRDRANRAMARESLELMTWIIRNDRPFTEILTADYTVVNDYSALSYGIPGSVRPDPNSAASFVFRQAQVPGWSHAGVVSTPTFVSRYPTTATNRNRHRARVYFDRFLATDILAFAERPSDPTVSAYHNATLNDPQCTVCHATMDPVAGLFQNFDVNGQYNPPENGWFPELAPPGFDREMLPPSERPDALRWLGERAVQDPRFALAMVQMVYKGLTGSEPLRPVTDATNTEGRAAYNAQRAVFDAIAADFRANEHNFRVIVRGLLLSDLLRADEAGTAGSEILASAGMQHLLTPEELDRKILAITGYPWRQQLTSVNYLSSRYRLLYGGIDSDGTTVRLRAPNGIMVNIASRMANDMACRAVPRDFVLQTGSRRLFPFVEATYSPESDEGFDQPEAIALIRQNIQYLHLRILGEDLPLDHPEIQATYDLFYDVWIEGRAAVAEDRIDDWLPSNCRAESDFYTGNAFPEERRIRQDPRYVVRAWMAVVTYLLTDYRFLYE